MQEMGGFSRPRAVEWKEKHERRETMSEHHFPPGGNLPDDLSQGWLPEDTRQKPRSPFPEPTGGQFQSLLPRRLVAALRHPGEMPWLIVAYATTIVSYIALTVLVVEFLAHLLRGTFGRSNTLETGVSGGSGTVSQFVMGLLLAPLVIYVARAFLYAQQRARGIRITPTQFPQAYYMIAEAARAAGLRRMPDAYVISGNGTINAFASGHGHRRYIALYSDLFEVGGASRDPDALRFVIGHEIGHIAAGHVSYFRLLLSNTFLNIPILGAALGRAQEYTADNFGYRFCPEGAKGGMKLLAGGKYLNAQVNFDEFADRAVTDGGFWMWLVNVSVTHPILPWRFHAIRNRNEPGRLFWRPRINPPGSTPSLVPPSERTALMPDPQQAIAFMDENRAAWESYSLDTVQVFEKPAQPPAIEGTLYAGWLDRVSAAEHEAFMRVYSAVPAPGQPGVAPGFPPNQQPPAGYGGSIPPQA